MEKAVSNWVVTYRRQKAIQQHQPKLLLELGLDRFSSRISELLRKGNRKYQMLIS